MRGGKQERYSRLEKSYAVEDWTHRAPGKELGITKSIQIEEEVEAYTGSKKMEEVEEGREYWMDHKCVDGLRKGGEIESNAKGSLGVVRKDFERYCIARDGNEEV